MPWVRFDDQFPIHRKTAGMSDAAFRLHVSAIFWCARNLTDGFVPEEDLGDVCARVRTPGRFAAECVAKGIWHPRGEPCESDRCIASVDKPGWVIHDYLEYQFSRERVMAHREANKDRQKRHRDARNGSSNGVSNGVSNAPPDPTRPEPGVDVPTDGARASPPVENRKPLSSMTNGAAARQPPPVAEAIARALHPEDHPPARGRHAKENP